MRGLILCSVALDGLSSFCSILHYAAGRIFPAIVPERRGISKEGLALLAHILPVQQLRAGNLPVDLPLRQVRVVWMRELVSSRTLGLLCQNGAGFCISLCGLSYLWAALHRHVVNSR